MKLCALADARKPVILISGPTGVGKSEVAMRLAARLGGEIVSVDSVQVYTSLDVGSNKPSAEERARIPHHLIDVCSLGEAYTAGDFYRTAADAIVDVHSRNRVPICVGGTSMYMHWLVDGTPTAPKADPELAASVAAEMAPLRERGEWDAALDVLRELDADRAAALGRNDWYRLMRALTIARQTSTPLAQLGHAADVPQVHEEHELRAFFLYAPREQLGRRIDERCERMLADGLLRETCELLESGSLVPDSQAGRAVGYRQAIAYLLRADAQPGDLAAFWAFVHDFAQASRAYATQQMKWFRKEHAFEWIEVCSPDELDLAVTQIELIAKLTPRQAAERRLSAAFEEAQGLAHRRNLEQGKSMKQYISVFPALRRPGAAEQLVAEADAFGQRLSLSGAMRAGTLREPPVT